ncbi:Sir2 family protein [Botrytis cinerea]
MGQEASQPQINPNDPPHTLSARSIEGVADFIKSGKAKNIVVMTGAGISTSAGIPDFRSPETGIYANLAELNLPYAEAVFDIDFFRENPAPFYVLAKELYPGQFYPTVSHAFVALIEKKGLLRMLFTQNIDCLERRAGVSSEKVIEAHGSFATQRCIDCKTEYPDDMMKKAIEDGDPATCLVPQCGGLVKPDIVHCDGHQLECSAIRNIADPCPETVPRLLFNMISVGDIGSRLDDVAILGDCDSGVRKLADALGWRDELEELWISVGGNTKQKEAEKAEEARLNMSRDELFEADIKELTGEIDEALKFSSNHTHRVNTDLQKNSTVKLASPPVAPEATPSRPPPDFAADKGSLLADITNGIPLKEATTVVRSAPIIVEKNTETKPTSVDLNSTTEELVKDSSIVLDVTMPQNMPNSSNTTTSP